MTKDRLWFELVLNAGSDPWDIYRDIARDAEPKPGTEGVKRLHHFGNEPWAAGRWVVRLEVENPDAEFGEWVDNHSAVERYGPWEGEQADRDLYGPMFDVAMDYFQASSTFAARAQSIAQREWMRDKLIHCTLNAHGGGDSRWALRYLWDRWRLFWQLKILRRDPMTYHQRAAD